MEILMLREHREYIKKAAAWFHAKWGVPQAAYEESMLACLEKNTAIPQWYLAVHRAEIIGGVGVIENDFQTEKISPPTCVHYLWRKHGGIKELPVNCFNLYAMIWRNGISIPCIC